MKLHEKHLLYSGHGTMIDLAILLTIGFAASSPSPQSISQSQPQPQPDGQNDFPVYANFETSTDGTTVTAPILDAGTPVKGCTWRNGFVRTTAIKVSTDAQHNLLSTLLAGGQVWTDFGSTRGVTFDVSILGTTPSGERRVGEVSSASLLLPPIPPVSATGLKPLFRPATPAIIQCCGSATRQVAISRA